MERIPFAHVESVNSVSSEVALRPALGRSTKALALFLIKLLFSVALVTLLLRHLGTETLQSALENANVPLLLLGCCCCVAQLAISVVKWRLLLTEQGIQVRFRDLFEMQLTSTFINVFMPNALCGDAYRAAKLRHYTGSLSSALPSVIVDRVTGLLALVVPGMLGFFYVFVPSHFATAACLLLTTLILGYLALIGPIAGYMARLAQRSASHVVAVGRQVTETIKQPRVMVYAAVLSFVFQLNIVLIVSIWAAAINLSSADILHLFVTVPVSGLVEMLPFSVNGIGIREATFSLLFGKLHLSSAEGFVLGLTVSAMKYVTAMICGLLSLSWPLLSRREREHVHAPARSKQPRLTNTFAD